MMSRPGIAIVGLGMAVGPHARSLVDLQIADFLAARDEDREPMVSGADAVAIRRLIDAMLVSRPGGETE